MDTILSGSASEVSQLLQNRHSLHGNNWLGQTAIHAAVLRPRLLSMLLDISSDFDSHDIEGNSPLVYAAAYGCLESVMLLLRAGANPLKDQHLKFLEYAMRWDRWDVMTEAIKLLRANKVYSHGFLQSEMNHLITNPWSAGVIHAQPRRFKSLLKLGADRHAMVRRDQNEVTLLHVSSSRVSAIALFEAGFKNIDHLDSQGYTPLMKAIWRRRYDVCDEILAQGCNINIQNGKGRSALHTAYTTMMFRSSPGVDQTSGEIPSISLRTYSDDLAFIAKLLQYNADIWMPDNCRCPCSPGGCPPFLQLPRDQTSVYFSGTEGLGYLWVLEWLLMLEELRGKAEAQRVLQYFTRVREFELVSMTHVCCRSVGTESFGRIYDERFPDNKKIDEILEVEKSCCLELDEKITQKRTADQDQDCFKENWLSMLVDFHVPNRILRRKREWYRWDPVTGHIQSESNIKDPLNYSLQAVHDPTDLKRQRKFFVVEEESDRYLEVYEGGKAAQSQLYTAWVEWFYRNRTLYDYPIPIDTVWYEKRKYWAARQAEVLEGLF
jgi:ankyrin repeat protein